MSVPEGIESYSGRLPVTFGVPFPPETLNRSHSLRIVDGNGVAQPAAFDRKTWWTDPFVKWVHVDLSVPVIDGTVEPLFLEFGAGVEPANVVSPTLSVRPVPDGEGFVIDTGLETHTITPTVNSLGDFPLRVPAETFVGAGEECVSAAGAEERVFGTLNAGVSIEHENGGPHGGDIETVPLDDPPNLLRATIKVSGSYRAGSAHPADFVTRYRFHAGSGIVRVDHTLVWRVASDCSRIASLAFVPREVSSGAMSVGVDGAAEAVADTLDLRQVGPTRIVDALDVERGAKLDGWLALRNAERDVFWGMRWPWQQYPTRVTVSGEGGAQRAAIHLIGPGASLSLDVTEHAIPELRGFVSGGWNIPERKAPRLGGPDPRLINPVGLGKSYELMLWNSPNTGADYLLAPEIKARLLHQPIFAYADPDWVSRAELPSPSVSRAADHAEVTIERALDAMFDWMTRERSDEHDYGIWNYGDIQYDWRPSYTDAYPLHSPAYRYWMNNGKGWGVVPWMLWMRSGERKYIEHAEANSRHLMDVDTAHVDAREIGKHKGGTYEYGPIHFGQSSAPALVHGDSEYLSYAFHLTGHERAADVILERQHALSAEFPFVLSMPDTRDYLRVLADVSGDVPLPAYPPELRCTREHYNTFGELAIVHEETHRPDLREIAESLLDAFLRCQADNGWLPGVKSDEWFSQALLIGARAFPERRGDILDLLEGWEDHVGTRDLPSMAGQMAGPFSLWTLYELERRTSAPVYGRALVGHAEASARSVHHEIAAGTPDTGRWRGLSEIPGNKGAAAMRGWMVARARLADPALPRLVARLADMTYFRGQLPTRIPYDPFESRHVIYVLDRRDTAFDVTLDFAGHNQGGGGRLEIRIHAPDTVDPAATPVSHAFVLENNLVDAALHFTAADDLGTRSSYRKSRVISVPADGLRGAYAIEITARGSPPNLRYPIAVAARSSTGRLVHYMPGFGERRERFLALAAENGTYCAVPLMNVSGEPVQAVQSGQSPCSQVLANMRANIGGVQQSLGMAGGFWFRPEAPGTPVSMQLVADVIHTPSAGALAIGTRRAPKVSVERGRREVCTSVVVGTDARGNPVDSPCLFTPRTVRKRHRAVLLNEGGNLRLHTKNVAPFLSASRREWFDPERFDRADPEAFLVPMLAE